MNPDEAYLKERGFQLMTGTPGPDESRPYLTINPSRTKPGHDEVMLWTGYDSGFFMSTRREASFENAGSIADFVGNTCRLPGVKDTLPRGKRISIFADDSSQGDSVSRDTALLLVEMYGGLL